MKFDEGKPNPSLFYTSALYETVFVRAYGIKKHGSIEGWKTTKPIEHFDAAIRHIRAVIDGEDFDKESGKLHLAHAICCCMFEIQRIKESKEEEPTDKPICIKCKKNLVYVKSSSLCWSCFTDVINKKEKEIPNDCKS